MWITEGEPGTQTGVTHTVFCLMGPGPHRGAGGCRDPQALPTNRTTLQDNHVVPIRLIHVKCVEEKDFQLCVCVCVCVCVC